MEKWEELARILGTAIEAIDRVIRAVSDDGSVKVTRAADALTAINAILDAVRRGDVDQLDPVKAGAEVQRMVAVLGNNDQEADAALAAKFPTPPAK